MFEDSYLSIAAKTITLENAIKGKWVFRVNGNITQLHNGKFHWSSRGTAKKGLIKWLYRNSGDRVLPLINALYDGNIGLNERRDQRLRLYKALADELITSGTFVLEKVPY